MPLTGENEQYTLKLCTNNLWASANHSGHPRLKHCYAQILDQDGNLVQSLSYGLSGVGAEKQLYTASTQCQTLSSTLSSQQVTQFVESFAKQGEKAYQWGKQDCCSMVSHAVTQSLNQPVSMRVAIAQQRLQRSRDLSRIVTNKL
ncbi:hypothetical protein [Shewanella waksmanii]|uniref:hypothetical protein n=1 Tax=Shewanella waksmanii TaxID=213783 RepID=UPI00373603FD